MPLSTFRESLSLLRSRRFGTFWGASLLSNIGTWAQLVAEPWLLLGLGASSLLLGFDTFAMSAPAWVLSLAGGVLADRADRRRVIAGFQALQMLCPTAILLLLVTGHLRPWMVIGLSLVVGVTDALSMPAFSTIVPTIVRREQIAPALALNATQFNLSRIAGPAIAGLLMTTIGMIGCFAISAASYVPLIAVALWILPRARPTTGARSAPMTDDGGSGTTRGTLRTVLRRSDLRRVLASVLASALLCAPLVTFYPVLVRNVIHGDAASFSIGVTAFGVGGLVGALSLLAVPAARDRLPIVRVGAIAHAVLLLVVATLSWARPLPLVLLLAGIAMSVSGIAANTYLQERADVAFRGRVISLYMLGMRGGIAVGAVATGWLADRLGVRDALLIDGALALGLQVLLCVPARANPR